MTPWARRELASTRHRAPGHARRIAALVALLAATLTVGWALRPPIAERCSVPATAPAPCPCPVVAPMLSELWRELLDGFAWVRP